MKLQALMNLLLFFFAIQNRCIWHIKNWEVSKYHFNIYRIHVAKCRSLNFLRSVHHLVFCLFFFPQKYVKQKMSHQRFSDSRPWADLPGRSSRTSYGFRVPGANFGEGKNSGQNCLATHDVDDCWCVDVDVKPGGNTRAVFMGKCIKVFVLEPAI